MLNTIFYCYELSINMFDLTTICEKSHTNYMYSIIYGLAVGVLFYVTEGKIND